MNLNGAQCLHLCATQFHIYKAKIALYENVRDNLRCLDMLMIKMIMTDGIWVCCGVSQSGFLQVFLLTQCALGLLKFFSSP